MIEQTVILLGTLAAYNPECRDFILKAGALPPLLRLVRQERPISLLKDLSYTISIFCGVTHPKTFLPPWGLVSD